MSSSAQGIVRAVQRGKLGGTRFCFVSCCFLGKFMLVIFKVEGYVFSMIYQSLTELCTFYRPLICTTVNTCMQPSWFRPYVSQKTHSGFKNKPSTVA